MCDILPSVIGALLLALAFVVVAFTVRLGRINKAEQLGHSKGLERGIHLGSESEKQSILRLWSSMPEYDRSRNYAAEILVNQIRRNEHRKPYEKTQPGNG